jgi:hypothetical protein
VGRSIKPSADAMTGREAQAFGSWRMAGTAVGCLTRATGMAIRWSHSAGTRIARAPLAAVIASLVVAPSALGQEAKSTAAPAANAAQPAAAHPPHYQPDRFAGRAGEYYRLIWGVDTLVVKWTESGEVIRFSYRVLDPAKAAPLNDKRAEPQLNDPKAGVQLVVPSMEKIGQLRQSGEPEAGKSYWMAFSNKGRLVKRGDHVNVVIGKFRADGLVVD